MTTHPHTTDNTVPPSHIQTFTGRHINPFDPDPAAIDIEDIAHALSHICRFTGHTRTFYSVAEHCVRAADYFVHTDAWHKTDVSLQTRRTVALMALLHDASEAYLTDIPRPLKPHLFIKPAESSNSSYYYNCSYREAERALQITIYGRFGIDQLTADTLGVAIHHADLIMLATERRDLLTPTSAVWPALHGVTPLPERITPMHPANAKADFLSFFYELHEDPRS